MDTFEDTLARANTKIVVAKHFVSLHRVNDVRLWKAPSFYKDDERYLLIHNNMLLGQYGKNKVTDDDYTLTIPAYESRSGLPVEFNYRGLQ